MKKIGKLVLLMALLVAGGTGAVFAGSTDLYMSVPITIDRTDGTDLNATAIGGGLKFSTAEYDDAFGVGLGVTAYYPLAVSQTENSITVTKVSELYSVPLGLDFSLGLDVNMLRLGFLAFPLSIGAHSKVDFYKPGAQINFGLVGSAGAKLYFDDDFGLFARAQISYDFYGTQHDKSTGKWNGGVINQWGIQPQIGVSVSF